MLLFAFLLLASQHRSPTAGNTALSVTEDRPSEGGGGEAAEGGGSWRREEEEWGEGGG